MAGVFPLLGAACAALGPQAAAGPYPQLSQYEGREIRSVEFLAPEPFSRDTLLQLVETQPTSCRLLGLPVCIPGTGIGRQEHRLDTSTLASDVVRLAVFYRQNGYFGTHVRPGVQPKGGQVAVTFAIERGDEVTLDSLMVEGTEDILDPDSLAANLPLRTGQLFDVEQFVASGDSILSALQQDGYAYAQVLRNYGVDTVQDRATVSYLTIPGPQVRVDSVVVLGAHYLGRASAVRQLEFGSGDLLRLGDLAASQRNLYGLDLVQFATVEIAADSLQLTPADSSTATVSVRISEAPVHVVETSIGYGSVECLRARSSWTSRSFYGGARRFVLTGNVSKIGLGGATYSRQLESSICNSYRGDPFRQQLDYHLGADLTQPYFFSAHNQLTLSLFADRTSEPGLYQRTSRGSRFTVARRFRTLDVVTAGLTLERGRTTASPAVFCVALQVCEPIVIDELARTRWRNRLSTSFARDRTDVALNPKHGYRLASSADYSAPWLASDVNYERWTGEAAYYSTLKRAWIAAAYVRLGTFFGTGSLESTRAGSFIPPEERFYAGGATSVRGFNRNQLGPGVWVADTVATDPATGEQTLPEGVTPTFVPVGGTAVSIASAELRFPSPVLGDLLRLAAFVDAGQVGAGSLWDINPTKWKVTPGLGVRVDTPVGPARLDIAYNGYGLAAGPLLVTDQRTGTLFRIRDSYDPGPGDFFSRLRLHVAVGQAF